MNFVLILLNLLGCLRWLLFRLSSGYQSVELSKPHPLLESRSQLAAAQFHAGTERDIFFNPYSDGSLCEISANLGVDYHSMTQTTTPTVQRGAQLEASYPVIQCLCFLYMRSDKSAFFSRRERRCKSFSSPRTDSRT